MSTTLQLCEPVRPSEFAKLDAQAAIARGALHLGEIALEIARDHGATCALEIVGRNWRTMTGRAGTPMLVHRLAQKSGIGIARLAAMTDREHGALDMLLSLMPLTIYRATDSSHYTGWYPSKRDALAAWPMRKPALWMQSLPATRHGVQIVKEVHRRWEIVPDPFRRPEGREKLHTPTI